MSRVKHNCLLVGEFLSDLKNSLYIFCYPRLEQFVFHLNNYNKRYYAKYLTFLA